MVWYRKVPIYAPFVMQFLNSVWAVHRPREPLTTPANLTEHEVKVLSKKTHKTPRFSTGNKEDVYATSNDDDFELEAGAQPTWVEKLTSKIKKTFCLQTHIQKKLYKAYVAEKMARRRQIQLMRHLNVPDVKSGSEKTITPEDTWCLENCQWSDEAPASSSVRVPEAATARSEESEEAQDPDDDIDDDASDSSVATGQEVY